MGNETDLTNDYYNDGTQIEGSPTYNKGVEDAVVPNNEKNNDNILDSGIDPPQTIFWKLKEWMEWVMKLNKFKLKEWTLKLKELNHKMKEWTKKPFLLKEKGVS